jgi:hypothetical protein
MTTAAPIGAVPAARPAPNYTAAPETPGSVPPMSDQNQTR